MCPNYFPDELFESMTSATDQIPASPQLRDSVLSRTTGIIRQRRRMRQAGIVAALVSCYLAGIATVSLRLSSRDVNRAIAQSPTGSNAESSQAATRKPVRPEDDQIASNSAQPVVRLTPYERLRRTGDQQLEQFADIAAATRSYEKALQIASTDQRQIAPDHDTWLLMALKHSSNNN